MLDFNDDILSAEYESFLYGLNATQGLDLGFHVEYKAFSFDYIIPDPLFKLDNNILYMEYKSFCGFDVDMSSNEDFCAEYESFSVDPVQADLFLEYFSSPLPHLLSS